MVQTMVKEIGKTKKPMRLLVHAPLGVGGVTNLMLDIQRNINREKINFDYLVFHDQVEPQEKTAFEMGSKKLIASADNVSFKPLRGLIRLFKIKKVCKKNEVKVFHFNGGAPLGFLTILAAKMGGVKWVTFHSHNGGMTHQGVLAKIISGICRPLLKFVVDDYWACSSIAAKFSFPSKVFKNNDYYFMPNAIQLDKYKYNQKDREIVKEELGLRNKFVIGHAGRFSYQKNHTFLIDIFEEIHKKDESAVLLLFGTGDLLEDIKNKVSQMGLKDSVRFFGLSDEMNKMYQGMDVFLMPSHFEGLPVTGVEAQASGLPIIFSDTITREVSVAPNVEYVSLNESTDVWADKVLKYKNTDRKDYCEELKKAGFAKEDMVEHFQSYYLNLGERLGV